jgi:hypothetical protein
VGPHDFGQSVPESLRLAAWGALVVDGKRALGTLEPAAWIL